jgi:orotate phosphoribosyltransferase
MATSTEPTTSALPAYKTAFLQACLSANVLTFGTYTLKSGRRKYYRCFPPVSISIPVLGSSIAMIANAPNPAGSPYFFNAGSFHTSTLLSSISNAYAHTIVSFLSSNPLIPKPDILFG